MNISEILIDNYYDSLDAAREKEEKALWEFFGGDYELFLEAEREKEKRN